jgi:hypothetical protein
VYTISFREGTQDVSNLAKKLGIQPGYSVCLLDAPASTADLLRDACSFDVNFDEALGENRYRVILFWPNRLDGLTEELAGLQSKIAPDGAIWVVIPKKKFAAKRGITFTWEAMQAAGLQTDLVDNKVATVSEEEYGTRFVIRKDRRGRYV